MMIFKEKSQGSIRWTSRKNGGLWHLAVALISFRTHEEDRPDMQGSG